MSSNTLDQKMQGFQLLAQEKLQAIICSIPGKKDLILDQTLMKPLEHVCSASWLKLKGIQRFFKLQKDNTIQLDSDHVQVFMIRSQLSTFQVVIKTIHSILRDRGSENSASVLATMKNFHIICVPRCFSCFRDLLETEGLYGFVDLHWFNWDVIYLDEGVLSMEVPDIFRTVFINEDKSLIPPISHTLRTLQMICGCPDMIISYGENASAIVQQINILKPWQSKDSGDDTKFSALVIIDRDKDYASTLLTPASYASLLLEVFNSQTGEMELNLETNKIDSQKLAIFNVKPSDAKGEQTKVTKVPGKCPSMRLNSKYDEIYGVNRYKRFAHASKLIHSQAKSIGLEVNKLSDMKLDEIQEYVARKLPKVTELKRKVIRHLNASEKIIEMLSGNVRQLQSLENDILNNVSRKRILQEIDELLVTDGQKYNTLRLICLMHLCCGVAMDELAEFIQNYCNYFGLKYLYVFQRLAKAGLLPVLVEEEKSIRPAKLLSNLPIPKFQQTEFQANANRLKLLTSSPESVEANQTVDGNMGSKTTEPNSTDNSCPSYVFNGLYIPLISQLCSFLLKSNNAEEFANKVGMIERIQMHVNTTTATGISFMNYNVKTYANNVKLTELKDHFPLRRRNIFVYVVGGCTYAEIAACDLIARLADAQIVVASDCIISGGDLIASAF